MVIMLNNRKEEIPGREEITVRQLLDWRKFTFKFLVVRLNDTVIGEDAYDTTLVRNGDKVMVLHLMAGG